MKKLCLLEKEERIGVWREGLKSFAKKAGKDGGDGWLRRSYCWCVLFVRVHERDRKHRNKHPHSSIHPSIQSNPNTYFHPASLSSTTLNKPGTLVGNVMPPSAVKKPSGYGTRWRPICRPSANSPTKVLLLKNPDSVPCLGDRKLLLICTTPEL